MIGEMSSGESKEKSVSCVLLGEDYNTAGGFWEWSNVMRLLMDIY